MDLHISFIYYLDLILTFDVEFLTRFFKMIASPSLSWTEFNFKISNMPSNNGLLTQNFFAMNKLAHFFIYVAF